ncbi:DUF2461 domain-containing protein [Pseudarthrobacter sp. J75]|uniref:DUF2461 domain-containing protein n=1 Tax=unclassified Pseudarthrobacter TaxID=2647000 RepID=UPI002E822861|nr:MULTISPECIES: DUF2461 domain-containing protein [unclassified Pseudarthrobacter]MEE2523936.1 DUF2461 domain-containing protein [Pseudarthrobacter sp. J47]MEE2528295.1 DUF2461 domain-containing protein [Pseudarthrobacter sp. J75]
MTTFQGIPAGAFEFYSELEQNNNRQWWQEHEEDYRALVREPLAALLAGLEPRFGPGKIFRPYRDMRFARDGVPLKNAQGAFASVQEGVGYYIQISADGLLVGGGYHSNSPAQLARFRNSVDASGTGEALQRVVDSLGSGGFALEGERLKTIPRGYPREHPRAELLKHKTLSARVELDRPEWLGTSAAMGKVGELWEQLRPLVEWVGRHAAP